MIGNAPHTATLPQAAEVTRIHATPMIKRVMYLASDAVVLTLASPFFAVWWLTKLARRLTASK